MHTMYVHIVFVDKTGYPKLLACKTWQETLKKTSPSECAATTPACLTVTVVWCSPATRLDGSRGICVVAVVVHAGLDQVARLEMKKIAVGGLVAWLVDLWKDVSERHGTQPWNLILRSRCKIRENTHIEHISLASTQFHVKGLFKLHLRYWGYCGCATLLEAWVKTQGRFLVPFIGFCVSSPCSEYCTLAPVKRVILYLFSKLSDCSNRLCDTAGLEP